MKRYWSYFLHIVRHKWFVFWECLKMGVPLWIAVLHDWTKLLPREFFPYAKEFFNSDGKFMHPYSKQAYNPNDRAINFKLAWLSHQRNKHHWQAWISIGLNGNLSALPIPEVYLREMIADWRGIQLLLLGKTNVQEWYSQNKDKMIFEQGTRIKLEGLIAKEEE